MCCVLSLLTVEKSRGEIFEADFIPWSGYWWPSFTGGLVNGSDYQGSPSPLEKYDYAVHGIYKGPATGYGIHAYYKQDALSWEGMCFSWAAASILEKEPVYRGYYNGILFNVGDKKGLLTATYEGLLYNRYNIDTPLDFHNILEDFVAGRKIPIIMDLHTNNEVWNFPIFKYETDYIEDGNIRHYTTKIFYASDDVSPDYIGTAFSTAIYYYYFVINENGDIIESQWENISEYDHPLNASEPLGMLPKNPGLDYETLKKIVNTIDDPYENNNTREKAIKLNSGHYSLISIDSDYFQFDLKQGDILNIRALSEKKEELYFRTYTPQGILIKETFGGGEHFIHAEDAGMYILEVIPTQDSGDILYELFVQQTLLHQGIFLHHPGGSWADEIMLTSSDKNTGRVIFSLMDKEGVIHGGYETKISSYLEGLAYEDFNLLFSEGGYIRLDSDMPLKGSQTLTYGDYLMMGLNYISYDKAASEIYFPHIAVTGGWETYLSIVNIGSESEKIKQISYGQEGQILNSDTIDLAPGQMLETEARYNNLLMSGAASMSIAAESENKCLIGSIRFHNPSYASRGRAIIPLTSETGPELVIPHIASDSYWWTGIAVMNTGTKETLADFYAYDAAGNQIGEVQHMIKPKQNLVNFANDIFFDMIGSPASIRIISPNSQPLCGFLLYGSKGNQYQLAGVPIHPASVVSELCLSQIASDSVWWTGIGIVNTGNIPSDMLFSLFNKDGDLLSTQKHMLNPNQQFAVTIKDLFGADVSASGTHLKIKSALDQPVNGIYVIGSNDNLQLMGDVIQ